MAQHRRDFSKGPEFADPGFNLVDIGGVLRLRQRNNNGQWAPYGKFGQGNALIDTWTPQADVTLTGFIAEAQITGQDQLLFRLSPDGGATQLWWNGSAWAVATDPILHWNTEDVIDGHIATFPIGIGVSQIVRFVSFNGSTTPELSGTSIYYEVEYDPMVDLLDSLARRIASGLTIQGVFQVQVPPVTTPPTPPSNIVTVDDPIWTLNDPIKVFNDTTDPNHRTNLYVSRAGNALTLTAPQTGLLTVFYTGTLDLSKIHIATDADVEKAELPAIVLQTPQSQRVRFENTYDDYEEILRSLGVIRRRKSATFEDARVHVQCNAAWDLHGRKLRDAVYAFVEEQVETLHSRALDELLVRTWIGPFAAIHDLPEQTNTFDMPAIFSVLKWPGKYRDLPIAQSIQLNIWPSAALAPPLGPGTDVFATVETIELPLVPITNPETFAHYDDFIPTPNQVIFHLTASPSDPNNVIAILNHSVYLLGKDFTIGGPGNQTLTWISPIVLDGNDRLRVFY